MPAVMIPARIQTNLLRMFRDPYILEKEERSELVQELRDAVSREPEIPELRVLLGMTLCVNFDAQPLSRSCKSRSGWLQTISLHG